MSDDFARHEPGLTSPAADGGAVTPSDTVALPRVSRALYVGGAGDLRVQMVSGTILTLAGVPAGSFLPVRVAQVMATGTTATGIVALR